MEENWVQNSSRHLHQFCSEIKKATHLGGLFCFPRPDLREALIGPSPKQMLELVREQKSCGNLL